jgi:hypothetical protein
VRATNGSGPELRDSGDHAARLEGHFKGGWHTGLHGGRLLHQVGRLERDDTVFSVAVLMDGVPNETYGMETLEDFTKRLWARSHLHCCASNGIPSSSHLHTWRGHHER